MTKEAAAANITAGKALLEKVYADVPLGKLATPPQEAMLHHVITLHSEGIALDPDNAGYYHDRSKAYMTIGAYSKALADINQAIALTPEGSRDHVVYRGFRAFVYSELGDSQHAIADSNYALERDSTNHQFHVERARMHLQQNELSHALSHYNNALLQSPDNLEYLYERNGVYMQLSKTRNDPGMKIAFAKKTQDEFNHITALVRADRNQHHSHADNYLAETAARKSQTTRSRSNSL